MKKLLKWALALIAVVAIGGLLAFLYFIPPFESMPPEAFIEPEAAAAPSLDDIADPAVRAIAEHGRDIVVATGCIGCHQTPGPEGPRWDMYLAGGFKMETAGENAVVSRNLTPDKETGLGARTDAEILRALRSGVRHDGRLMNQRHMPWAVFSNWTDEDRYAVLVFLRHVKPVVHKIPNPVPSPQMPDPAAAEASWAGRDHGEVPR